MYRGFELAWAICLETAQIFQTAKPAMCYDPQIHSKAIKRIRLKNFILSLGAFYSFSGAICQYLQQTPWEESAVTVTNK